MRVKAPSDVVEYIRSKFWLNNGEVEYKKNTNPKFGTCAKFDGETYSKAYVKDVLEGKDPDLSVLFDKREGSLFRNNDPVWGTRKGVEVTKSGTLICGVKVLNTGAIVARPGKPKKQDTNTTDYYKAIEVPEHIKRLIHYRFKIRNGVVVYKHKTSDSGAPLVLEKTRLAGHRYAASYVLAVLKGEKPNLESLFTVQNGCRVRNDDPVWQKYKNIKASKPFYSTCGEKIPVSLAAPAMERANDFAWLDKMERVETPGEDFIYAYSYDGGVPSLAHRINGVMYSAGYITSLKAGEAPERPPIPRYLFKKVRLDFGDGSYVVMTSDEYWPDGYKLLETIDTREYMINGFIYTGEEIIKKISKTKSCTWSWEEFYQAAKYHYPDNDLVANIKLDDSEFTGEM